MTKSEFKEMISTIKTLGTDELIKFLRELRSAADASEQRFLFALVAIEKSGVWRRHNLRGEKTFLEWIDRQNLCRPARYNNWRQAVDRVDFDVIQLIGVHGTIRCGSIEDESQRSAVAGLMVDTAQHNGVPLSDQTARAKVEKICGPSPSRSQTQKTLIQRLQGELRAARAKIQELEHELKLLRERLGDEVHSAKENQAVKKGSSSRKRNRSQSALEPRVS